MNNFVPTASLQKGVIFPHDGATCLERPLLGAQLKAGFPSPAEDYIREAIDLNRDLVRNPLTTFYAYADGDSMEPLIHDGALVMFDTSLEIINGCMVAAVLDGTFCIKWYRRDTFGVRLESENPDYAPILIEEGAELHIRGRIVCTVQKF